MPTQSTSAAVAAGANRPSRLSSPWRRSRPAVPQPNQHETGGGEHAGHADAIGQNQQDSKTGPAETDRAQQYDERRRAWHQTTGDAHADQAQSPAPCRPVRIPTLWSVVVSIVVRLTVAMVVPLVQDRMVVVVMVGVVMIVIVAVLMHCAVPPMA